MSDAHPNPDEVERAEEVERLVRHPHHDETTQREALENALQDEGASEGGEVLGDG
jgi:hypothetical protein